MTPVTLGWLQIAALLGAIHGCVLAVVLASRPRNRVANRLLAAAMVVFSVALASSVYHGAGLEPRFPHFFGVGYPLPLLFGPFIYLYTVTASDRARGLRRRDALHFLPFVLVVAAALPIYLMSAAGKMALLEQIRQGSVPLLIRVVDPLKYVSGIAYAVVTLAALRRHRARIQESYASLERVNLRWLLRLAGASAAIWALATALAMTDAADRAFFERSDDVIALAVAVLVYAIGYMALRQPEVFDYAAPREPDDAEPSAAAEPRPYERSGLSEPDAAALERKLLDAMERDRLYQDSDLTLADLADRLGTSPHKLSEVLNGRLDMTFYDFVNGYRVREVQRRIADERSRNLTILALAMDAGFASKSTFNHVFRQRTGQTPSAYRRSLTA